MQDRKNPYGKRDFAYKKSKVTTNDPVTLVILLYDGAIRFLTIAEKALENNDYEKVNFSLLKAKDIISELIASLNLDQKTELVENLRNLYNYMYERLLDANIEKNKEYILEVKKLLKDVREAWDLILKEKNHSELNNPELKKATITLKG